MQVTDAMVAAALKRAGELEGGHPERWIHRETMREALQAALDASPEQATPRLWQLPPEDRGITAELFTRSLGRVWLRTPKTHATDAGQFHNEGGDFLPGPKRIRTGASGAAPAAEPALPADTPEALRSFTAPLDGSYDPLKLVGVGSIAGHLGVSFTQVDTWIKEGPAIRFPEPSKWTTFGPRWQLGVIDQWYESWKASNGG